MQRPGLLTDERGKTSGEDPAQDKLAPAAPQGLLSLRQRCNTMSSSATSVMSRSHHAQPETWIMMAVASRRVGQDAADALKCQPTSSAWRDSAPVETVNLAGEGRVRKNEAPIRVVGARNVAWFPEVVAVPAVVAWAPT
jgi:hypothetical protein